MLIVITILLLYLCYKASAISEQNQALGRNDAKIYDQLKKLQKTLDNMPR